MAETFYKELDIGGQVFRFAVNITGSGAPAAATAAEVGMFYMDTGSADGDVYKCTGINEVDGVVRYTWIKLGEADLTEVNTKIENLEKAIADQNEAIRECLKPETVKSTNLIDESTIIHGSWWTAEGLISNQYTADYWACSVSISGQTDAAIKVHKLADITNPMFKNYYYVYGDGTISETLTESYAEAHTIAIPENVVELRFNLKTTSDKWNLMVNEGTEPLPYEPYYVKTEIPGVTERFEKIENTINPKIVLSHTLHAVVGDTIQVFFKSIVDGEIGNLHIMFACEKGKNYPRYWEYTPGENDVGNYPITVNLLNNAGEVIAEKSCTLVVSLASNPSAALNVLCLGDSLMESGQIPIEASRRLKGTAGAAATPANLSLSNVNFVGRKRNDDATVGWEGTGGWTYGSYIVAGYTAIRFTVSDATNLNIGAVYRLGEFLLTIAEINVTDGSGNIRCLFHYSTPYTVDFDSTEQSGTMTLSSGNAQDSIMFTAWSREVYQPFWNVDTGTFDIQSYVEKYCNGQLDVICVLLGINSLINTSPFTEVSVNEARTLFENIHSQLPDCKIIVSTLPIVSPNGGISANYGASSCVGAYSAGVINHAAAEFNSALIELAESADFNAYVSISNTHAQFDAEHSYPTTNKAVNTRSDETEELQSNAVHPNNAGYWQIADAMAFRTLLNVI